MGVGGVRNERMGWVQSWVDALGNGLAGGFGWSDVSDGDELTSLTLDFLIVCDEIRILRSCAELNEHTVRIEFACGKRLNRHGVCTRCSTCGF
jgi:hypothetical protein